ncbi:MAG TPA: hypothetical protein VJ783_03245 [Pirellulales bacterium]|nr:hypothetical protein [Pirellulales bacterium]
MPRRTQPTETIAPAVSQLTPLELFALGKATGERQLKELRPRLQVGDGQAVDFTVRIRGELNVAGESSQTTSEKPPVDQVLAAVLSCLTGRARAIAREHVQKLFRAWTAAGEDLPEIDDQFVDAADDLLTSLGRSVTKSKKGNVTASLAVERIEGSEVGGRGSGKKRKAA